LIDSLCAVGADEQGVAVAKRARRLRGGKIAASARLVLDHNGLREHRLQVLSQQSGRKIGASSGGKGYDDRKRFAGPISGRRLRQA